MLHQLKFNGELIILLHIIALSKQNINIEFTRVHKFGNRVCVLLLGSELTQVHFSRVKTTLIFH